MGERLNHLELPFIPEDLIKKPKPAMGPRYKRMERNENDFSRIVNNSIDIIKQKQNNIKKNFPDFVDPDLIFKLLVNQSVYEEDFRKHLERMDIGVLSAAPDKKGYWIVFSDDEEFKEFQRKQSIHTQSEKSYSFFYAIGGLSPIPSYEKIGESLLNEPFGDEETSCLDIEIWRMETIRLMKFLDYLRNQLTKFGGHVVDELITHSFCLLRVKVSKQLFDRILELPEIAFVDRPPKVELESSMAAGRSELNIGAEPPEDATGILIVDSGITSSHPLLENAVGDEIVVPLGIRTAIDEVGHGTQVAGIALYGDIKQCMQGSFSRDLWIFSAKVMFKDNEGRSTYNENTLLENDLRDAVERIVSNYPNCRVINLSIGNNSKRMFKGKRLYGLSSLIDDLYNDYNVIFVASAGNIESEDCDIDYYPNYLIEESSDRFKINDCASSALAITVGAICNISTLVQCEAKTDIPSPITRVGLGYKGAIKPELVEMGGIGLQDGDGFGAESDIITINPKWVSDGRLFTLVHGTSFSAAKTSHHIAKLINMYPDASRNLIKALIISSARIPELKPEPLSEINVMGSDEKLSDLLKIYGYGKPNYERSIYSDKNRVVLLNQNGIKLKRFHVYSFYVPKEFVEESGTKSISVTLVFDPPLNKNRSDYFGLMLEAHLFKNISTDELVNTYRSIDSDGRSDEKVPESASRFEIKLHPGINLRKRGVHQKGIKTYKKRPDIDASRPLNLVIFNQNHWIKDDDYIQDYAIIVALEHSGNIELYNQIHLRNRDRVKIIQKA
jgi:hypothetical protein